MKVLRTSGIIEGSEGDLTPFISHFYWIFGIWKLLTGFLDFCQILPDFLEFCTECTKIL